MGRSVKSPWAKAEMCAVLPRRPHRVAHCATLATTDGMKGPLYASAGSSVYFVHVCVCVFAHMCLCVCTYVFVFVHIYLCVHTFAVKGMKRTFVSAEFYGTCYILEKSWHAPRL